MQEISDLPGNVDLLRDTDPGGQAVLEGDRQDIKAEETGMRPDGGEEAASEDRCR